MPPLRLVERRNANQAMHARLAADQPIREFTRDGERSRLDARLVPILNFVDLRFESLPLRPAQVHAHQHLCPVLALGAAGPRMHRDDRVQRVGLAGEHGLRFQLLGERFERRNLALQIRLGRLAFLRQFEVSLDVVGPARQLRIVGQQRLQPLALAHQRLRLRSIRPHAGVGNLLFNDRQFPLQPSRVKDTPAAREPVRAPGSIGIPDRQSCC